MRCRSCFTGEPLRSTHVTCAGSMHRAIACNPCAMLRNFYSRGSKTSKSATATATVPRCKFHASACARPHTCWFCLLGLPYIRSLLKWEIAEMVGSVDIFNLDSETWSLFYESISAVVVASFDSWRRISMACIETSLADSLLSPGTSSRNLKLRAEASNWNL